MYIESKEFGKDRLEFSKNEPLRIDFLGAFSCFFLTNPLKIILIRKNSKNLH